jgi:NAD-dependent dihydropyrimidine dehydrogenase PreA subunit
VKNGTGNLIKSLNINLDVCTQCKLCVEACFQDVIRWDEKNGEPVTAYPEDCVWCLACEEACPVDCIDVVPIIPMPAPPIF